MALSPSLVKTGPLLVEGIILFRMEICREIIRDNLHEKPEYFEEFSMSVYCFDDPKQQEQVL